MSILRNRSAAVVPSPAKDSHAFSSFTSRSSESSSDASAGSASSTPSDDSPKPSRVGRRRRWKSAVCLAAYTAAAVLIDLRSVDAFSSAIGSLGAATESVKMGHYRERKAEWIELSVQYYSTVMRKNNKKKRQQNNIIALTTSQVDDNRLQAQTLLDDRRFVELATKHYYARNLIKVGKWTAAEKIYRRIIRQLTDEANSADGHCDHAKLAISTLLLALHVQRSGDVKAARAVFLEFFRRVAVASNEDADHKCECSAKVLQAYALFEMKNGHSLKSLQILHRAVEMDGGVRPVLEWKQFRDAAAGRDYEPAFRFRKAGNASAVHRTRRAKSNFSELRRQRRVDIEKEQMWMAAQKQNNSAQS